MKGRQRAGRSGVVELLPKNPMQTTSDIPAEVDTKDATGTSGGCIGDLAKGSSLQGTLRRIGALFGALLRVHLRDICCATSLLAVVLCPAAWAKEIQPDCPLQKGPIASQTITRASSPNMDEAAERVISADSSEAGNNPSETFQRLIVIGFMGGNIRANNFVHREALLAKDLQQRYSDRAACFSLCESRRAHRLPNSAQSLRQEQGRLPER